MIQSFVSFEGLMHKYLKIDCDCSLAKHSLFRNETNWCSGEDLQNQCPFNQTMNLVHLNSYLFKFQTF